MKKVLFISFYWPPSGKASIHWPLDMVKYLPEYGWEPSVLTVKEDSFSEPDKSLGKELPDNLKVFRTNFWDPFYIYKKLLGKSSRETLVASEALTKTEQSMIQKLSVWIRMNLFIPDARMGWYFPGISEAKRILKREKFDLIVSNGPPHTAHLLGKKLSKKFKIPLVPVFIDPWVDIAYYRNQKRSKLTLKIDNHFERSVMEQSSQIIMVTNEMKNYFEKKYPFVKTKSNLLYWGYNESIFKSVKSKKEEKDYKILLHAGNIFDYQNPKKLWNTIKNINSGGHKIRIRFVGTVGPVIKKAIKENDLENVTEYFGFLSYPEVLEQMCNADYLLVCATEPRHLPGKLFEYMRTGNPILAFGDGNSEVANILKDTNSGMLFNYENSAEEFFTSISSLKTDLDKVLKFDRKKICSEFAEIINRL